MLTTLGDIKNDFLVMMNQSTTVAFYTDSILNTWINKAHTWAAAKHKWPFTQARDISQVFSGETYAYPTNFKSNSIRLLQVGGYRIDKLNYVDYQIYREEQSSGQERVYTDFDRTLYINPNIDVGGTITAWGQILPTALDTTDPNATTVFSNAEEEGNEAILQEVISYALTREKTPTGFYKGKFVSAAMAHHQAASDILDGIWARIQEEQFGYQTKYRGQFKRFDVLRTGFKGELNKENQFF